MPPHRPWRPAATERRLSLVRRSSSLLVRRSARSYLSLPGMVGKSSRSERFSRHQAWKFLVSQQVRRGSRLPRVGKESEVAAKDAKEKRKDVLRPDGVTNAVGKGLAIFSPA